MRIDPDDFDPFHPNIIWDDVASDWEENREASLWSETKRFADHGALVHRELSDLDAESVRDYRRWFERRYPGHPWVILSDEGFLQKIGAVSDECEDQRLHPTEAGLLMFGIGIKIKLEFPNYFLDYQDYLVPDVRTTRIDSDSPGWSGNVFGFFTQVSRKLVQKMKTPFRLVGIFRIDWDPTHDAVREALVNCLVHADYRLPPGVLIITDPYQIALRNPGTISIGKEQMLRGGVSEPRNGGLLRMFYLLGFGKGTGSGVPGIFSAWKEARYLDPIVEESGGLDRPRETVLILPLLEN